MNYKIKRVLEVNRYRKVEEVKDEISGVTLVRYLDTRENKEFLTFKSKDDARKYYEPWIGNNEEALQFYVESAILESELDKNSFSVIEYETEKGFRYQPNIFHNFSFGKGDFTLGVHIPIVRTPDYPPGWFFFNVPMKTDDKIVIGVGSVTNMGKSYKKEVTIDEFIKIMQAKGKFYTPYIFENNKRQKRYAIRPENTITMICIDLDDIELLPDLLKIKENGKIANTLLNRTTYYLQQISKSGKGLHIFIPVKVKSKSQLDKILIYMQMEMRDIADISIYEPARLIFSSPYRIEEVAKIALAKEFYTNKELTEREPYSEYQARIKAHQLTVDGRRNYLRNSGILYIRTYIDGNKLIRWFEDKFGKITSKKIFSIQLGKSEEDNNDNSAELLSTQSQSNNNDIQYLARVEGDLVPPDKKRRVRSYNRGLIPLVQELSEVVGFPFKRYESFDEKGRKKVYYQISISPYEKTPMDCFWYLNNPEFIYFQSSNALRHLGKLKYVVSYTTYGRPTLHISHFIKMLWIIVKNFSPDFRKEKFLELVKKHNIHERYIYSHFEEIENYIVEMIRKLKSKGNKPIRVNKFIPKEIISTSKVWKSMRHELEKLGFKFKRTREGLVFWYEGKNEDDILNTSWYGLPPKLRKELRKFFESLNITWYAEIVEERLEDAWIKRQWYWVYYYVCDVMEKWEQIFKKRLYDNDFLLWIDKGRLIKAKSYVIGKMVA
jgi:hypothetical protein